jgi:hypothetical protein
MRRKERGHGGEESPARGTVSAAKKQLSSKAIGEISPAVPESLEALRRLPRARLVALARSTGLKGRSRLNKEELVLALGATLGIASAEKAIPQSPAPRDPEDLPLPEIYGMDRLVLLPIDPYWVHAYWELAAPQPLVRGEAAGDDSHCILRVYDVTSIYFDGTNAHGFFDIQISGEARNWYINLWSPGRTLCAELGLVRPDGSFTPLVRSNVIQTPPAWSSTSIGERWVRVEWRREDDLPLQAPFSDGGPAFRWRDSLRAEEYRRFLRGTHWVKILQPDEPPPPGLVRQPAEDAPSLFDPGLSSSHLIRTPGSVD